MAFRIGLGYDAHRLVPDRKLILGGIEVPFHLGCQAHSDGDAIIHAIIDALLGAAGLSDIGTYFPDHSEEFKNIDSRILLSRTMELITREGFRIGNVDCTILLEKPRLKDHIPMMRGRLAEVMGIEINQIAIKAGTNEKMGFVGQGEGVAVYAVALLENQTA